MANIGDTCPTCGEGVVEFKKGFTKDNGDVVNARRCCSRGKNACSFVEWIKPANGQRPQQAQGPPQQASRPSQHPNAAADARLRAGSAAWQAACAYYAG